jgi:hypothetical protein
MDEQLSYITKLERNMASFAHSFLELEGDTH